MSILLELPMAPTMNIYWRRGPNRSPRAREGSVVTHVTKEGRKFRKEVYLCWLAHRPRTPLSGAVAVRAWIWFARHGSDVDNRIKPTLDALEEAGVFENDRQVSSVSFRRMDETRRPAVMLVHLERDVGARTSFEDLWKSLSGGRP